MSAHCCEHESPAPGQIANLGRYRRILWVALLANAAMLLVADPAEALRNQIAPGWRMTQRRGVTIAVRLAKGVPTGRQRHRFFRIHRHPLKGRAHVAR